ncbi:hypothetical protein HYU13_04460 [Candidatus Woesearchaeota archaeon]|nr:hypothetical protein [Candidatus Woesearchaeota archaeon]
MAKKWVLVALVLGVLVVGAGFFLFFPREPYYSDDPKDWIENKEGNVKEINIKEATSGKGYIDFNGLQYETEAFGTVFSYDGWYQGNYFRDQYTDPAEERVLMRIGPSMKPHDGVIEGFIIEKVKDGKPLLFIFLDNDWRNNVQNTTIFWGKAYQNDKLFNFSFEVSKGVYLDWVEDDAERFENNYNIHNGGVWVGELKENRKSTIIGLR